MQIPEFSDVVTTREIERYGLPAGAVGTVVDIHDSGRAYEVEFDAIEDTFVTATLTREDIRPVASPIAASPSG